MSVLLVLLSVLLTALVAVSLARWVESRASRANLTPGVSAHLDYLHSFEPLSESQREQLLRDACRAALIRPRNEVSASVLAYSHNLTASQLSGFLSWSRDRLCVLSRTEAGPMKPRRYRCIVLSHFSGEVFEVWIKFVESGNRAAPIMWPSAKDREVAS